MTTTADDRDQADAPPTDRLIRTPRTFVGPYVTVGMPLRSTVEAVDGRETITVSGRVLNGRGEPAPRTMVETSQPEGWTRSFTEDDGVYRITTVKPAGADGRAPHITLLIALANFMIRPAVTCLFFPDEDNENDELFAQLSPEQRATMLARRTEEGYEFDVHLAGDTETTFLGWPGLLGDED